MTVFDMRDDAFGTILDCATKYAVGRGMYLAGLVVGYISPLVPNLSTKTLWSLKRDINEFATHDALGDYNTDAKLWLKLLDDVVKELEKRGR